MLGIAATLCDRQLLGTALLGPDRIQEWRQIAPLLEERGLPKVDQLMGGRYVPAVRAFFDRLYGLDRATTCRWHPMVSRTLTDGNNGKAKAPGLTWRERKPIWRASRAAIKAGFKPAWVNLTYFANDEAALIARCHRLTAEANEWLTGRRGRTAGL